MDKYFQIIQQSLLKRSKLNVLNRLSVLPSVTLPASRRKPSFVFLLPHTILERDMHVYTYIYGEGGENTYTYYNI